ncbi:1505_t:CDS:1, partial [Ambispora leptoticha]
TKILRELQSQLNELSTLIFLINSTTISTQMRNYSPQIPAPIQRNLEYNDI